MPEYTTGCKSHRFEPKVTGTTASLPGYGYSTSALGYNKYACAPSPTHLYFHINSEMSSSAYSIHPALLDNGNGNGSGRDKAWTAPNCGPNDRAHPHSSTSPFISAHLSPYSHIPGDSASPTPLNSSRPADSLSVYSEHYPISDFSDFDISDPFCGVDFNGEGGTPSFLGD